MTTKEEFQKAIELINACRGTINCRCKYDKNDAESLAYICREFLRDYKERTEE